MTIDDQKLLAHFDTLSDEEILGSLARGELTNEAEAIAWQEVRKRGLIVPGTPQEPEQRDGPAPASGDFVLLTRLADPLEANVLHSLLESEGIPSVMPEAHTIQTNMLWSPAMGGVRILVQQSHLQQAQECLRAFGGGEYAIETPADADNAEGAPAAVDDAPSEHSRVDFGNDPNRSPYAPPKARLGETNPANTIKQVVRSELEKGSKMRLLLARGFAMCVEAFVIFYVPLVLLSLEFLSPRAVLAWEVFGFLILLPLVEWAYGASPGKILLGLTLVTASAKRPGFIAILVRRLLLPFEWFLLGPIMILVTKRAQRLGDMVTGIYVVQTPQLKQLDEAIARFEARI